MKKILIISNFELARILKRPLFWSVCLWPLIMIFSIYSLSLSEPISSYKTIIVMITVILALTSLNSVILFPLFISSKTTRISEFILSMSSLYDQYYGKLLASIIIQASTIGVTTTSLLYLNEKMSIFNTTGIKNILILKAIIGMLLVIHFLTITIGNIGSYINNEDKLQFATFIYIVILNLGLGIGMKLFSINKGLADVIPGFGGIFDVYENNILWFVVTICQILMLWAYQKMSFKYFSKNIFNCVQR